MSYELNEDLAQVLVHMESVLDLKMSRSDALAVMADHEARLAEERINQDADVTRIERLEDDVEQLSEQIS
jgi:hypothetical protein